MCWNRISTAINSLEQKGWKIKHTCCWTLLLWLIFHLLVLSSESSLLTCFLLLRLNYKCDLIIRVHGGGNNKMKERNNDSLMIVNLIYTLFACLLIGLKSQYYEWTFVLDNIIFQVIRSQGGWIIPFKRRRSKLKCKTDKET